MARQHDANNFSGIWITGFVSSISTDMAFAFYFDPAWYQNIRSLPNYGEPYWLPHSQTRGIIERQISGTQYRLTRYRKRQYKAFPYHLEVTELSLCTHAKLDRELRQGLRREQFTPTAEQWKRIGLEYIARNA